MNATTIQPPLARPWWESVLEALGARDAPLRSIYVDDPTMAELVGLFVGELPERIAQFDAALKHRDRTTLRVTAHQLRGAAGGYGFPDITQAAGDIEGAVLRGESWSGVERAVARLVRLCRRACMS